MIDTIEHVLRTGDDVPQTSGPPRLFAYRWDANIKGIGDTLVEFTLTPEGDGTRVRVVESGFASLATTDTVREELRQGNVGGWQHEFGDLERYATTVAA
jgi:uncharacterized protein YndB with AHSA1/START domain